MANIPTGNSGLSGLFRPRILQDSNPNPEGRLRGNAFTALPFGQAKNQNRF